MRQSAGLRAAIHVGPMVAAGSTWDPCGNGCEAVPVAMMPATICNLCRLVSRTSYKRQFLHCRKGFLLPLLDAAICHYLGNSVQDYTGITHAGALTPIDARPDWSSGGRQWMTPIGSSSFALSRAGRPCAPL